VDAAGWRQDGGASLMVLWPLAVAFVLGGTPPAQSDTVPALAVQYADGRRTVQVPSVVNVSPGLEVTVEVVADPTPGYAVTIANHGSTGVMMFR
jgi:hypothetical protein